MAQLLNLGGMVVGAVGIFIGFYFLSTAPLTALAVVTGTCVGVVGVLAFLRHVVFHRADAARMGWQTDRPDWQFEVGFANLAFGIPGLLVALFLPSYPAFFVLLLGYALYLAQAAALHLYSLRDRRQARSGPPLAQRHRHVAVRGADAGLRLARPFWASPPPWAASCTRHAPRSLLFAPRGPICSAF